MKLNVGSMDRILRVVVGAGLVTATALGALPVWGYIGIVPLVTGAFGLCPIYSLFKLSSNK
ncbi:MAG: DUF2892 domain-containing protein [Pseudomonadota bacterium]